MFGRHRKSLIRAFGRRDGRAVGRRGRPALYGQEVVAALKGIWRLAEQACSKRLKALIPLWLPHYERHFGALAQEVRRGLLAMSPATMDRHLRHVRVRRGLSATRSVRHVQGQIPIRTRFDKVEGPGYIEADTVAHCGGSLAGAFVWSVTFTDIWSGWTENCAVWNRNARQIVGRLGEIEAQLPFGLVGFDSDNGAEFINGHLLRYLRQRPVEVEFTRSRPYRKNDNAHVEQKQWTHVRQLLGYDRLDNRRLVALINDLYRNEWRLVQNFFLPNMRLISKVRDGSCLRRRHDAPRTPCQRLLDHPQLDQETKESLQRQLQSLDPVALKQRMEEKLRAIFRLARRSNTTAAKRKGAASTPILR